MEGTFAHGTDKHKAVAGVEITHFVLETNNLSLSLHE